MKASELIKEENDSLLRWGRQRDKIIDLIDPYFLNSPTTKEEAEALANNLFKEIMKFEQLGRERVRIYWETKEDESERINKKT